MRLFTLLQLRLPAFQNFLGNISSLRLTDGCLTSHAVFGCCTVIAVLQELARQKALLPLYDAAKERAETLRKQRADRKKAAAASGAPAAAVSDDDDDDDDGDEGM